MVELSLEKIPTKALAIGMLILMLIIDVYWGQWIFNFADGLLGDQAIIIKIMTTFVLIFGTIIVPILTYTDKINPHPLNLIYGIGQILIGIPAIMLLFILVIPLSELLLTDTLQIIVINLLVLISILLFSIIFPITTMLQENGIQPNAILNSKELEYFTQQINASNWTSNYENAKIVDLRFKVRLIRGK